MSMVQYSFVEGSYSHLPLPEIVIGCSEGQGSPFLSDPIGGHDSLGLTSGKAWCEAGGPSSCRGLQAPRLVHGKLLASEHNPHEATCVTCLKTIVQISLLHAAMND